MGTRNSALAIKEEATLTTSVNFTEHLKKQLGFLERSCQLYDHGYIDEGVRIATVIRVLVHNTNASTSLLKHLNATTINMLSTTFEPSPQTVSFIGMGMMKVGGDESSYFPQLGNSPINELIPLSKWWNQVVMVIGKEQRISRKEIVLAAANKDGGAHVDSKLTKNYEALSKDGAAGYFGNSSCGKQSEKAITNAHLVSLRQMAYEMFNSQELTKIVNNG